MNEKPPQVKSPSAVSLDKAGSAPKVAQPYRPYAGKHKDINAMYRDLTDKMAKPKRVSGF